MLQRKFSIMFQQNLFQAHRYLNTCKWTDISSHIYKYSYIQFTIQKHAHTYKPPPEVRVFVVTAIISDLGKQLHAYSGVQIYQQNDQTSHIQNPRQRARKSVQEIEDWLKHGIISREKRNTRWRRRNRATFETSMKPFLRVTKP